VSFAAITLCVASQRVFVVVVVVVVYFVIDSVRKLLDTPSYGFRVNFNLFYKHTINVLIKYLKIHLQGISLSILSSFSIEDFRCQLNTPTPLAECRD
jgi:hypothetical protein